MTIENASITADDIASHGLTEDEYQLALDILGGREPNMVELGIFSVMWSEHCSYKSSKKWLKTLPTEAPWVICGPGENAGCGRYWRRPGCHLQDGKPQPPLFHRTLPGGRDGALAASSAMYSRWARGRWRI